MSKGGGGIDLNLRKKTTVVDLRVSNNQLFNGSSIFGCLHNEDLRSKIERKRLVF